LYGEPYHAVNDVANGRARRGKTTEAACGFVEFIEFIAFIEGFFLNELNELF
jgi:hypothetical protein